MTDKQASAVYGHDFDAIEAAVMETSRGRWFLGEFARRNRVAETGVLLDAIGRLERNTAPGLESDRSSECLAAIRRAVSEAGVALSDPESGFPGELLARAAHTGEAATADIASAAEHIQDLTIQLRASGTRPDICDGLDRHASAIRTACGFHHLTAERTRSLLDAFRVIHELLDGAAAGSGEKGVSAEVAPTTAQSASPVASPDPGRPTEGGAVVAEAGASLAQPITALRPGTVAETALAPVGIGPRTPDPAVDRASSLDKLFAIDRLDLREKLKLFT